MKTTVNTGIGFFPLLFLVLMVLKLTHYINWSWAWITLPLWGGIAFMIGLYVAVVIAVLIAEFFKSRREKKVIRWVK